MRWIIPVAVILLILVLLFAGSGRGKTHAVNVIGSTSIQPFAEYLSQSFNAQPKDFTVDVQGGGSTAGLQAVLNGVADVGMCSRSLKADEATKFDQVVIASDGLAVVVHPANPVSALTRDQVRKLFAGEVTNWKDVGGADQPVRLITREEGSGTREAFTKLVMHQSRISRKALTQESNGSVKELVKYDRVAIGYMSLGLVGEELKALKIDGVAPVSEEVKAKRYPLVRPFLFVTRKGQSNPRTQTFIDFVLSPEAQAVLVKEGLVSVR